MNGRTWILVAGFALGAALTAFLVLIARDDPALRVIGRVSMVAAFLGYVITHSFTARRMRRDLDYLRGKVADELERLATDEGAVSEMRNNVTALQRQVASHAARTVELRNADMILARAILPMQDRLRIARETAVERLGEIFRDTSWKD